METLLRKRKTISSQNDLQEQLVKEINLDEVTNYLKVLKNTETVQQTVSLKDDWMQFIDMTMSMMHSKISF